MRVGPPKKETARSVKFDENFSEEPIDYCAYSHSEPVCKGGGGKVIEILRIS